MSQFKQLQAGSALPSLPPMAARHVAAAVLYGAARMLAAAAERMAARAATRQAAQAGREFHVVEVDGAPVGMVYEDGRLVALLPEVGRL